MERDEIERLLASFRAELERRLAARLPALVAAQLDDLVQDASLRLWRALERESAPVSSASYLHRVAANATIDALRRHRARREEPLVRSDESDGESGSAARGHEAVDPGADPERAASARSELERVERAVVRLAPDRRRALRLHLRGFTTEEIGALLGWSEARARNLVYRALGELRARMEREERR